MNNLFNLKGKLSIVTGAASGIGKAIALGLAECGSDVIIVDRDEKGLLITEIELKKLGIEVLNIKLDLSSIDDIDNLFDRVDLLERNIDFLANVAGEGILGKPELISIEDLKTVLNNLVVCRFYMCQQAGKRMLRSGKGSILNIGSLASTTALGRGHIAYSIAMGGVSQMTKELSTEWSSRGVRVNTVAPAQVLNDSLRKRMEKDPELGKFFLGGIPAGRLGAPNDIKGIAVLLASDASSWITGATIPLDGGNIAMNSGGTPGHMNNQNN